jgi:hypothetical protein
VNVYGRASQRHSISDPETGQADILESIETYYSLFRRHPTLNDLSPITSITGWPLDKTVIHKQGYKINSYFDELCGSLAHVPITIDLVSHRLPNQGRRLDIHLSHCNSQ